MHYQTRLDPEQQHAFLSIAGELDAGSAPSIESVIREILEQGHIRITVDATELTYISSAGIGAFIATLDQLRNHGGEIHFTGLRPNVRRVFDLLGLDQVFVIIGEEIQ